MLEFAVLLIALLLLVSLFTSMLLGCYYMFKQIKGGFFSNLSKFAMIGTAVLLFTYTSRYVVEPIFLTSIEENTVYNNIVGFLSSFIGY
tara:strand:- start:3243 stop:3509 length:267 start_codon:yes stop_codon:yes gene_type:complete